MSLTYAITPADVTERLEHIAAVCHDDEQAHSLEDALHVDVLKAIAEGTAAVPEECARLALTSLDMGFARWCA